MALRFVKALVYFVVICSAIYLSYPSVFALATDAGHGKGSHPEGVLVDPAPSEGHGATHEKGGAAASEKPGHGSAPAAQTSAHASSEAEDEAAMSGEPSKSGAHGEAASHGEAAKVGEESHEKAAAGDHNEKSKGGVGAGPLWFIGIFALLAVLIFVFT
jgi:hypothetical protein